MLDSDPSGPAAQASSDGTAVRVAIGLFALVALFFALRAVPAGDPDLPSPQAQLAETADPGPQADRSGEVSASENSVPALAWTPAARDYELRYTDAQGKEISRAIRFDPRQDQLGVQLQGESPWQMPLGRGTATAEQPQLTRDLRLLLDQAAEQKVYFPGGGWVEAKRQVSALPPRTRDGETRLGSKTTAKLRGETRSGERFHGQLQAELWLDAEGGDLIALRVKQTLEFADHGVRQIAFSLRPSGKERKVGGLPAEFQRGARGAGGQFGEQAREVAAGYSSGSSSQPLSLPGGLETPTALALLGSGLLLLFCAFVARWLGPTSALCVFLSVAIVCVPLVVTAQDKTSFGQRFSDPTENEIGYTVLATVSVGVGAVFAFMTAPVWVPVAVGVAGVTAI
ncbi:MAG: hypothetical protein JKY65_17215, partial [Planctomycetes bacterium]|nr:hypothetical protein [Planctomycetota bacterium]